MMGKDGRKEILRQWKESQKRTYLLDRAQAEELLRFVDESMGEHDCDDTLRFTLQWLSENLPEEQHAAVLEELESMGGYCDCEVMYNCYEDYDISI